MIHKERNQEMESSSSSNSNSQQLLFLLGCYTKPMGHVPNGSGHGISLASIDSKSGRMKLLATQQLNLDRLEKIPNPSFLTTSRSNYTEKDKKNNITVYSLSEIDESSIVTALHVNYNEYDTDNNTSNTIGTLNDDILFQHQPSGFGGAHIEVDSSEEGDYCFIANYASGNISIYGINDQESEKKGDKQQEARNQASFHMRLLHESQHGIPGKEDPSIIFPSSKFPLRQDAAHAHQIRARRVPYSDIYSDNNDIDANLKKNYILYVPDLGMDRIVQYSFRVLNSKETSVDRLIGKELVIPGGPRHLDFHPFLSNRAYVSIELESRVGVLNVNESNGLLEELIEERSALSESDLARDDVKHYLSSHIEIHPSGKFGYVANRSFNGNCSIMAFRIDFDIDNVDGGEVKGSGKVRYIIGHFPTRGDTPRHFTITPGRGDYLLVGNQDSHTVQAFKIDLESGMLSTENHMTLDTPSPSCIKFI